MKEILTQLPKRTKKARENRNTGIYNENKKIKSEVIDSITKVIADNKILCKTPKKNQQIWFIKRFRENINLKNMNREDIMSLECLKLGLRGDTFNIFFN